MSRKVLLKGIMFIILISIFQSSLAQNMKEYGVEENLQIALQSMDPEDELVHLRSINQRTFKKADGKRITFISTVPLNYMAEDAQLQPIDINVSSVGDCKFNCPPYFTTYTKLPYRPHWLFYIGTASSGNCSSIALFA